MATAGKSSLIVGAETVSNYIVSKGRIQPNSRANKVTVISAAAPRNAADGYAYRYNVHSGTRLWVYDIVDGEMRGQEFVVTTIQSTHEHAQQIIVGRLEHNPE